MGNETTSSFQSKKRQFTQIGQFVQILIIVCELNEKNFQNFNYANDAVVWFSNKLYS